MLAGTKKMGWYYILEATNVLKLGKEGMEYIIKDTKILPRKTELASVLKHIHFSYSDGEITLDLSWNFIKNKVEYASYLLRRIIGNLGIVFNDILKEKGRRVI